MPKVSCASVVAVQAVLWQLPWLCVFTVKFTVKRMHVGFVHCEVPTSLKSVVSCMVSLRSCMAQQHTEFTR